MHNEVNLHASPSVNVHPGFQKEAQKVNQNFSTIEIVEDKQRVKANRASVNSKEGESDA